MGKGREFWQNVKFNQNSYYQYLDDLTEIAISMFDWKNVPDSIDVRFLELTLFGDGQAIFFNDDGLNNYLALRCAANGPLNVYRIPINRRAYASNGYNKTLTQDDSVIIYNNYMHKNSMNSIGNYARRIYNIDRTLDININAQKTPILLTCEENERLTIKNLYMKYEGNEPVIYASKNLNPNSLKVLKTDAPYLCDKLQTLKTQVINEALTYLGISNVSNPKKERMVTNEVERTQGAVNAHRTSRLKARQEACEKINKMFSLNLWVDYNPEVEYMAAALVDKVDKNVEGGGANE